MRKNDLNIYYKHLEEASFDSMIDLLFQIFRQTLPAMFG